jgi:hypothetical protein
LYVWGVNGSGTVKDMSTKKEPIKALALYKGIVRVVAPATLKL